MQTSKRKVEKGLEDLWLGAVLEREMLKEVDDVTPSDFANELATLLDLLEVEEMLRAGIGLAGEGQVAICWLSFGCCWVCWRVGEEPAGSPRLVWRWDAQEHHIEPCRLHPHRRRRHHPRRRSWGRMARDVGGHHQRCRHRGTCVQKGLYHLVPHPCRHHLLRGSSGGQRKSLVVDAGAGRHRMTVRDC